MEGRDVAVPSPRLALHLTNAAAPAGDARRTRHGAARHGTHGLHTQTNSIIYQVHTRAPVMS